MSVLAKVVLVLAIVAAVSAQKNKPKFSDSFTSNVEFVEVFNGQNFSIYGSWYVDFVGRQHAFHANDQTFGPMQIYRYYNLSKQYEFYVNSGFCNEQMGMRLPFFGTFDFLAKASNTGNCADRHGNNGLMWTATINSQPGSGFELNLCASATANIPYFIDMRGQWNYQDFERQVQFLGYYPGTPDPSLFKLPQQCQ